MFLQYYVWGSWYVTMGTFMSTVLGSTGIQIGAAYSALAIATMISPFFIGMIADRYFAAQRVMGVLHIMGGILLLIATRVTTNGPFYWIILLYSLAYMPTIALSNSVAFRQMSDPGKQFPVIRVFGTVGWVVSGFMIAIFGIEQTPGTFYMAAIVSLGTWSIQLPASGYPSAGSDSFICKIGARYRCIRFVQGQIIPDLFHRCNICLHSAFFLFWICKSLP